MLGQERQLGLGDTTDRSAPVQVGTSGDWLRVAEGEVSGCGVRSGGTRPDTDWTSVSNGVLHTCGLRTDGTLWCWGSSANGQLGLGDTTQHSTPTQVGTGTSWLSLGVGSAHTCAVRIDVTLWCWGFNGTGQLGLSDYADRTAPVQVPGVRSAYVTATWFGTYATQFVP